jgi:hypothetical protein
MLERTSGRALPVINRAVDLAPAVQACCGVCRTCVTSNVFALAAAAVVGLGTAVRRLLTRR